MNQGSHDFLEKETKMIILNVNEDMVSQAFPCSE
jgi:hypothetical protein